MRSGGPGRPSASASSSSAPSVLPWSASQRACSRASVSAALRVGEGHQLALLAALRHARGGPGRRAARRGTPRGRAASGERAGTRTSRRDRGRAGVVLHEEAARGPPRRSPRAARRAGTRRARSSCRRGSRTAGRPPGCPGGRGRGGRARSGRRRPSSGSPSSARSPGSCRAARPPARSRSARTAAAISSRERLDERLLAALEEQLDLGDVGAVVVLRDRLDARALAALDVVQQARPLEGALAVLDVDRAGPEREEPPDEVHRLVDARWPRRTARSSGCRRSTSLRVRSTRGKSSPRVILMYG